MRIEQLAAMINMSSSSLHHHFKAITAMSPLQFQKQIRLHEARRMLLAGSTDAANARSRLAMKVRLNSAGSMPACMVSLPKAISNDFVIHSILNTRNNKKTRVIMTWVFGFK